jgi:CRISPR-associated endonuclease/helicase Cas3
LLRYYEFASNEERIEIINRARIPYELSFFYTYRDDEESFKNTQLNQLTALKKCQIFRKSGGAIAPTPLLKQLEKKLLPGVIIAEQANQGIIIKLTKQGIASYPISISFKDFTQDNKYRLFPSLSGILTIANSKMQLKLPDNEDFYTI